MDGDNFESPYLDYDDNYNDINTDAIYGGNIKFKDLGMLKWLVIGLLVCLIVYLVYSIFKQIKWNGEDYTQRQTRTHFEQLHGDANDEEAKQTIKAGEAIPNPRAIDHYRLGTTYLINTRNAQQAHNHFAQALHQIIGGAVDPREAEFILDRIDDFENHFIELDEVEDLPIQQALMFVFEGKANQRKEYERKKVEIKDDDPELAQKVILSQQYWVSDSQNVHDSAIYKELEDQLLHIRSENAHIPNIGTKNYADVRGWLKARYANTPQGDKIEQTLSFLDNNYPISNGLHEQDILVAVWQRAYDPGNITNFNQLREAIGDAVADCVDGGHVVCLSGRSAKIWQALALLDKDPRIGILKTKQALRNEVIELCAKAVDNYIGKNGSASQPLKESYQKGENTEQVRELIECIKQDIDRIGAQYADIIPADTLDAIIEECKSVL